MTGQLRDSKFYASAERIGTFLLANFITAFLLMTIIGAPLGLLALFAVMNAWAQGRQPEFFSAYLGSIRQHWRAAFGLCVLNVTGAGLVAVNLTLIPQMGQPHFLSILSLMLTLCFAVVMLMTNVYAWSFISQLRLPLRRIVRLSLILALSYPLKSLLITAAALIPLAGGLLFPVAFMLFLSLGATAYIASRGAWWMLTQHISSAELESLLLHELS